jgi:hypothetical protein
MSGYITLDDGTEIPRALTTLPDNTVYVHNNNDGKGWELYLPVNTKTDGNIVYMDKGISDKDLPDYLDAYLHVLNNDPNIIHGATGTLPWGKYSVTNTDNGIDSLTVSVTNTSTGSISATAVLIDATGKPLSAQKIQIQPGGTAAFTAPNPNNVDSSGMKVIFVNDLARLTPITGK